MTTDQQLQTGTTVHVSISAKWGRHGNSVGRHGLATILPGGADPDDDYRVRFHGSDVTSHVNARHLTVQTLQPTDTELTTDRHPPVSTEHQWTETTTHGDTLRHFQCTGCQTTTTMTRDACHDHADQERDTALADSRAVIRRLVDDNTELTRDLAHARQALQRARDTTTQR